MAESGAYILIKLTVNSGSHNVYSFVISNSLHYANCWLWKWFKHPHISGMTFERERNNMNSMMKHIDPHAINRILLGDIIEIKMLKTWPKNVQMNYLFVLLRIVCLNIQILKLNCVISSNLRNDVDIYSIISVTSRNISLCRVRISLWYDIIPITGRWGRFATNLPIVSFITRCWMCTIIVICKSTLHFG